MKKYLKIGISFLMVLLVVVSQTNLTAWAADTNNNIENQSSEANSDNNSDENVTSEQIDEAADNDAESDDAPLMTRTVTPFSSGFASFDGVDLNGNTAISKEFSVIAGTASEFDIKASFSGDASVQNRKIVININDGLMLAGAPGLTGSGVTWTFSEAALSTDLQGRIIDAEFVPNEQVYGKQIGSGVLTYTVAPGVSNLLVSVKVKFDLPFAVFTKSREFTDVLSAKTTQDINGVTTVINEEVLESFTITDPVGMGTRLVSSSNVIYGEAGKPVSITYDLRGGYNTYADGGGYLVEEQVFKFYIDKRVGTSSVNFSLPHGSGSYSIDSVSDATRDILYITLKEVSANTVPKVTINFVPTNAVNPGEAYLIVANSVDSTTKPYKANIIETNERNGFASQYRMTIAKPYENKITVNNNTVNIAEGNYAESSLDGINFIGGIDLQNPQTTSVTDQLVRFTFNDPAIGVKGVDLPSSLNVDVKNIVVKTTKGNTFTLDSAAVSPGYSGTGTARYRLNLKSFGVTAEDEYIAEVTYLIQELTPSYKTIYSNLGGIDSGVYGTVLELPASKSWSFEVATVPLSDGDFNGINANKAISTTKNIDLPIVYAIDQTIPAQNLAGNTATIKSTVTLRGWTLNNIMKYKGFEFYLREGEYLNIDTSSIKIVHNGTTYSTADGTLTPISTVDNTGNKVIKIVLSDMRLGWFDSNFTIKSAVISYNVKIKNTAPSTSIPANELMYVQTIDTKVSRNNGGSTNAAFHNPNKFDVDGSGNTTKLMGTMSSLQSLQITAQKDFTVTTAANLNNGPWTSYDYTTQQSVIDLNPEGDARYQVNVANNSGSSGDGYTVLIPIPKAGEATDMKPASAGDFNKNIHLQVDDFSWTASINEEIKPTGSLNYTVLYATSYATDKDSAAFVPWSAIANKDDIRMVKVTTDSIIPDGFNEAFSFPLVLSDPDADVHAGLVNIYASRIYTVLKNGSGEITSAGYKNSEPIAIRLKTGVVKGQVFNDTNRNGLKDAGETGRNGVTVVALEAGTTTVIETTTTKTIDGVDGSYAFLGLDKEQNVDIVFTNPTTDDTIRFSPVTSGGSTPTATATHDKATTANITPSAVGFDSVNAGLIVPVAVNMNAGTGGSTATPVFNRFPGEAIATEPTAVKTGHTFNGWFTAATGGSKVTFPYTVGTTDVTLYAQYTANKYVLSYDVATNGGTGTAPADEQVTFDTLATAPADAVKTGYTFTGWFDSATGGTKWNFATSKMPANAVKLYAQFTINSYTMTFDNEGATTTQTVVYDTVATEPTAPSKTGFTFAGWFDAQTGGTKWNFATDKMPAANKTLYAQYTRNNYTVTFNDQGTTTTQTVAFDALVVEPATVPTKAGYTFAGWFDATTGGTKWNFGTNKMPASNKTLYAQFTADDQTITFDVNGGNTTTQPADIIQVTDSAVDLDAVTAPTWFGHKFLGWKDAADVSYSGTITMPAGGLNLIAEWQDLIADGTWKIEASNVKMTLSEFQNFVDNNTIEQEILTRSGAKAWNDETDEVLTTVRADLSTVTAVEGTHIATVYLEDTTATTSGVTTYNQVQTFNTANTLQTTINVELYTDPRVEQPVLPTTGDDQAMIGIISGASIIGLAAAIIFRRKKESK